jgi:hypothetical protein
VVVLVGLLVVVLVVVVVGKVAAVVVVESQSPLVGIRYLFQPMMLLLLAAL